MAYPLKDYHPIFNKQVVDRRPSVCRQMINTCLTYVKWDTQNPVNFVAAAKHRLGVDTQQLTKNIDPQNGLDNNPDMRRALSQAADQLAAELRHRMDRHGVKPIPLTYDGAKYVINQLRKTQPRTKIQKLLQIAKEIPWDELQGYGLKVVRKSNTTIFIKNESYPGKDKPPRLICFPQEGEKLLMSMAFHHLMHPMFSSRYCSKEIPEHKRPYVIEERLRGLPRKFVADYTSFECVPNRMMMRLGEHRVYRKLVPREYWFLLDKIEKGGVIQARNGVKIRTPAVQYSGRYTTSLSNTIRNKLLMDAVAISLGVGTQGYRGVYEGDDSLTGWPATISKEDIIRQLGKLGVAAEIDQYEDIGKAGYCSMYWTPDYQLIYDPIKTLAKFPFTSSQLAAGGNNYPELLAAKAMSLAYKAPGCPIVSAVVKRYISQIGYMETRCEWERKYFSKFTTVKRASRHKKKRLVVGFDRWDLVREPTPSQRLLFEEIFGINPTEQREAERRLLVEDGFTYTMFLWLTGAQEKCGVNLDQLCEVYNAMRFRALLI